MPVTRAREIAIFAGGCFWCTEAIFQSLRGVLKVMPGYTGGTVPNPTYEQVCSGRTGHAEATRIEFDPREIAYRDLLTVFFATHDPSTLNRQGNDVGTQYRSAIFVTTPEQQQESEQFVAELKKSGVKVTTEIKPFETFYEAEDYHRDYYRKNKEQPYCQAVINPKLAKLKQRFVQLLKESQSDGA
ncbi:MAG: peptide-methionine (S)-S-oxide reductase MsrA [Candidatus Andersenbacteria bacterium]